MKWNKHVLIAIALKLIVKVNKPIALISIVKENKCSYTNCKTCKTNALIPIVKVNKSKHE